MSAAPEIIWITGASTGIGRALALQLARAGHRVIASARTEDTLEQLASEHPNITPLSLDISCRETVLAAGERLAELSPYLDRVILNAGCCEYMDFTQPDWSAAARVMSVNYQGSVNCIELALPLLLETPRRFTGQNRRGHIIGVVSQVTFAPFAQAEAYGASKAALRYFLNSLRIDLAPQGVDITVVDPGFVITPMTAQNRFSMPFIMSAEEAATRIVNHALARPRETVFPRRLRWLLRLSSLFPQLWQKWVTPASIASKNSQ